MGVEDLLTPDAHESLNTEAPLIQIGGRYVLDERIGRGAMSTVYAALDLQVRRRVALKMLRVSDDHDPRIDLRACYRREAEALASLQHPHVVGLLEAGELDDGTSFLVMPLVDGERLGALMQDGAWPVDRALPVLRQLADALAHVHASGWIHRDVKPANVLVRTLDDGSEHATLIDFGLVQHAEETEEGPTADGMMFGTAHCMGPEQIRGEAVDARSDLYAWATIAFRMLTGAWPFHGRTTAATLYAHLERPVPDPSEHAVLPEPLVDLITRSLAKDPADRPRSLSEVRAVLDAQLQARASRKHARATQVQRPAGAPPPDAPTPERPAPTAVSASPAPTSPKLVWDARAGRPVDPAATVSTPEPVAGPTPGMVPPSRARWLVLGALALATGAAGLWLVMQGLAAG